jgi:hypothetical protein
MEAPPNGWMSRGPLLPLLCGAITALWLTWLFGGLTPTPSIHDEQSYLLQAQLLATGRIAGPARPLAEFFEQYYVFVTPVTSSRYPPGWALALLPGVLLGLPALMPVLLTGATAALLVAGVRRLGGPIVALLAWLLWLGMPGELRFRPTLLTEHLSTLLMLGGWWSLVEWRKTGTTRWLLLLGAATAWLGITRPLTGLMYALVAAVILLPDLVRERRWRPAVGAVLVGLPFVALLLWHDHAVTGSVLTTPLKRYSEIYFPFDLPGYGLDTTPARRALPPEMALFSEQTRPLHVDFVPARLPGIAWERLTRLAHHFGGNFGIPLLLIAAGIGMATGGSVARWSGLFALAHFASYLTFAHQPTWTVYYLEFGPWVAALAALGVGKVAGRGLGPMAAAGYAAIVAVAALPAAREYRVDMAAAEVAWGRRVAEVPAPAIIFVRTRPTHNAHDQLVVNGADLDAAPRWIVHDRGAENARLMALAPERSAWLYDEATDTFTRQ